MTLLRSKLPRSVVIAVGAAGVAVVLAWLLVPRLGETSPGASPRNTDTSTLDLLQGEARQFQSRFVAHPILVLPGVFVPQEAEEAVLPFMKENAALFRGKRVLEIGTGSGIISVYAAQLGATKVVSTDISEVALRTASRNAERGGHQDVMETRLVPESDMSAYSVIRPDERFDTIISNPPYSLDLDAEGNSAVTDRGDLGFSIVRGLESHLAPGGTVALLYRSLFYHYVMLKFAEHEGYAVRSHLPNVLTFMEAETLFNAYLERLLAVEGMEPGTLHFDWRQDTALRAIRIPNLGEEAPPLLPGSASTWFPGMLVIQRK